MGMHEASEDFDSRALRNALGRFATGIAVVTAHTDSGDDVGLTVNSFTSVSLDPPLVLFCIARTAGSFDSFGPGTVFAVNILAADQEALSNRFATPEDDKFDGLATERWPGGSPVLPDCLASLECATTERVEAGDHVIVVGEVKRLREGHANRAPLLYFGGGYGQMR